MARRAKQPEIITNADGSIVLPTGRNWRLNVARQRAEEGRCGTRAGADGTERGSLDELILAREWAAQLATTMKPEWKGDPRWVRISELAMVVHREIQRRQQEGAVMDLMHQFAGARL